MQLLRICDLDHLAELQIISTMQKLTSADLIRENLLAPGHDLHKAHRKEAKTI